MGFAMAMGNLLNKNTQKHVYQKKLLDITQKLTNLNSYCQRKQIEFENAKMLIGSQMNQYCDAQKALVTNGSGSSVFGNTLNTTKVTDYSNVGDSWPMGLNAVQQAMALEVANISQQEQAFKQQMAPICSALELEKTRIEMTLRSIEEECKTADQWAKKEVEGFKYNIA